MKNFKLALAAAAVAVSFSTVAGAASETGIGADSTGTSVITMIKDFAVNITNVNDIAFGNVTASGGSDVTGGDDVCVFSSTGGYSVTVDSTVRPGTFELQTVGGDAMAYTLTWTANGVVAGTPAAGDTIGTAAVPLAADSNNTDCSVNGLNARFDISVAAGVFDAAVPGSYSDTVSLFVQPL